MIIKYDQTIEQLQKRYDTYIERVADFVIRQMKLYSFNDCKRALKDKDKHAKLRKTILKHFDKNPSDFDNFDALQLLFLLTYNREERVSGGLVREVKKAVYRDIMDVICDEESY